MLNAIKRTFVPKHVAPPAPVAVPAPTSTAARYVQLFDELPSPDMEERNTDSIWAEFESVHPLDIEEKPAQK